MGMYTEIYVNVDLKPETPEEILSVLRAMCTKEQPIKPHKWQYMFNNGSCYVPQTYCANLTYHPESNIWSLLGKGDIKNYDQEIEQFFAWLMPWIKGDNGDFIGYVRYEENQLPDLIVLHNR